MPYIACDDGVQLQYRLEGPDDAPVLVMSNSLGTTLDMWVPQLLALVRRFRVLRYDARGHGGSGISPSPYQLDRLGKDVLTLLDGLGVSRAHFCGLSMGGMTGMWLGVHAPDRIDRLALCNTAAKIGTPGIWNDRIAAVEKGGIATILPGVIQRWFTADFAAQHPDAVKPIADMLLQCPPEGYIAACGAIRDMDQRNEIAAIRNPTLVIAGSHDLSTPASDGRFIAEKISGARYVELPSAHLSNIECEKAFTEALLEFLTA
ncbi:MAG TPA: 3-oxoadipate enol-lactonase [Ferrovibrio sp.]|uniref:3-oxoadipate enol-lactonase n=1 Tax=Ferrovibrio sp. TaxID=1917215 RepID=UPI002ED62D61